MPYKHINIRLVMDEDYDGSGIAFAACSVLDK